MHQGRGVCTRVDGICPERNKQEPTDRRHTSSPPEVKVPRKMTCLEVWLMSMKPPQPGMRPGPKFDTFTLPTASTCTGTAWIVTGGGHSIPAVPVHMLLPACWLYAATMAALSLQCCAGFAQSLYVYINCPPTPLGVRHIPFVHARSSVYPICCAFMAVLQVVLQGKQLACSQRQVRPKAIFKPFYSTRPLPSLLKNLPGPMWHGMTVQADAGPAKPFGICSFNQLALCVKLRSGV